MSELAIPQGFAPIVPLGFNAHIGPVLLRQGTGPEDADRFRIDLAPHMLNGAKMAHGGFLMAIADIIMGFTAHEATGALCATVTLNCDFVASAPADASLAGTSRITRRTRSLVFLGAEWRAAGKVVLSATGIWKITGTP